MTSRVITATAPIRICDNGGWTDTHVARHGQVFNIAVSPLVTVRIEVFPHHSRDARVILNVENYRTRYAPALDDSTWGAHPLLEAALRAIPRPGDVDIEVTVRSDAPAGASTGTSAAVVVAMLGALDRLSGGHRGPREIAAEAHEVETTRLGRQCGVQDQLCCALGGINFIAIDNYPHARVTRLDLPTARHNELERRLALVYLGRPHSSSAVHEAVMKDLERLGPDCSPLNALRTAAADARDAVVAGDLEALGRAMQQNTAAQAELHGDLVQADARRVIAIAAGHGAAGWKVNGAGGAGGSITVLCGPRNDDKAAMLRAIGRENRACLSIPVRISRDGLRVADENPLDFTS